MFSVRTHNRIAALTSEPNKAIIIPALLLSTCGALGIDDGSMFWPLVAIGIGLGITAWQFCLARR